MTDNSDPLPGGPLTRRHIKALKISIAIMTVLLVAGLVALIYGLARQASRLTASSQQTAPPLDKPYLHSLDLGTGELAGVSAGSDFIVLYWKGEKGSTLLTYRAKDGYELGRIQVPKR